MSEGHHKLLQREVKSLSRDDRVARASNFIERRRLMVINVISAPQPRERDFRLLTRRSGFVAARFTPRGDPVTWRSISRRQAETHMGRFTSSARHLSVIRASPTPSVGREPLGPGEAPWVGPQRSAHSMKGGGNEHGK